MSIRVVVGTQWGDEGKGKMVDYFAQTADLCVRFQGGDNAGHTVANQYGVFRLHLIPCGIFYPNCANLIGTGTVVNPDELLKEINELKSGGISLDKLYISEKAHVLMPYHVDIDDLTEKKTEVGIGTTKRGIGPAYSGKAMRTNLRFEDLADNDYVRERLKNVLPFINAQVEFLGGKAYDADQLADKCAYWYQELKPYIVNPISLIQEYKKQGKKILFEGQLGVMKDLDLGIYPYVTSSHPIAAYAAVSGGFSPKELDDIVGVTKAFSSAVGAGPFPTEMSDEEAEGLRGSGENIDDEFGARTGRARRIGWLDLVVLNYAVQINGLTCIALNKVDKLDALKEIKVCVGYELDGKVLEYMPNSRDLYKVKPIYKVLKGWNKSTRESKSIQDLPQEAKDFLKLIEDSVGVPIKYVGMGPDRKDIIL
ncbi:MAG TPA: adenylosuccinate synthase [Clostridiales bacterium]|nr:adenylosuccinate synthase [Clostridiales bacterium]